MPRESKDYLVILNTFLAAILWVICLYTLSFPDWIHACVKPKSLSVLFDCIKPDPTGGHEFFYERPYFRVLILAILDYVIRIVVFGQARGYITARRYKFTAVVLALACLIIARLQDLTVDQGFHLDYNFIWILLVMGIVFALKISNLIVVKPAKQIEEK